ncbi:MAG TPA: hypothetical protein VD978_36810 [Azospirillum sp.]|nr:hypothetical protein [Azospirillum sp.]
MIEMLERTIADIASALQARTVVPYVGPGCFTLPDCPIPRARPSWCSV